MDDFEKLVWVLTYAAATATAKPHPDIDAIDAVLDFQKAQQRFNADFPTPPDPLDEDEEDLPF